MRKLVLMRGAPGVGKSTFIREQGLRGWTLSADEVRLVLGAAILNSDGRMMVDQNQNDRAFGMMRDIAAERMGRGETLVIDMMFEHRGDAKMWVEMAREHNYEVACLEFSDFPLERAIERDAQRAEYERVGARRIAKAHGIIRDTPFPDAAGINVIKWQQDGSHAAALHKWLSEPVLDLSSYKAVVHIGDIQGCHSVLVDGSGPFANGFRDDQVYIFVGDLLDRGIENGKVMRWFLDEAMPRKNVHLLWGNHEDHLNHWSKGRKSLSGEFMLRTLPQLEAAGITPADAARVCARAKGYLAYTYNGLKVFASHAGLSTIPAHPERISMRQYSHGTGYWEDPVDQQFDRNAPEGWYQVHGHRNHGDQAIRASERSFNLEDSVESGGNLRTVVLSRSGWDAKAYPNRVFRPLRQTIALERKMSSSRLKARKTYPKWIYRDDEPLALDPKTLAAMREHKGVREKPSATYPHIASLNFTKNVFYDGSWDDVTVKARGLFFNTKNGDIVARGYEKFFNIGEREETSLATLKDKLQFPLRMFVKENGFLGNVGYDSETDSLIVASKSVVEGPFAEMFREIFEDALDEGKRDWLRRYLRDVGGSMTFEVIDPVRDPHMIEYDRPKIVLLDILHRTVDFEKASYEVLTEVAGRLGIDCKEHAFVFKDWTSFQGWHSRAMRDLSFKFNGKHLEGFVIEDASGFMTKIKLPYYAFWKRMRGMKDRVMHCRKKGIQFSYVHTQRPGGEAATSEEIELAHAFRDWCVDQPDEVLAKDIISLRQSFELADLTPEMQPAA